MFVYTFCCIFTVSILIQSSIGFDLKDSAHRLRSTTEDDKSSNETTVAPTPIQKEIVCDKTAVVQKMLEVMLSMLRDDLSESSKTAFVLESFKEILKKMAVTNVKVMYKIDNLIDTLHNYEEMGDKMNESLRSGTGNMNNVMQNLVRPIPTTKATKHKIRLNYELPFLANSQCTEALLSIINIAYRAYLNLEKNPICQKSDLSQSDPDTVPLVSDFFKSEFPNLNPHLGLWGNLFPEQKSSPLPSDDSISSNAYPKNIIHNADLLNPYSDKKLPLEYKPVYEYHPNAANELVEDSDLPPDNNPKTTTSSPAKSSLVFPSNVLDSPQLVLPINYIPVKHKLKKHYLEMNPKPEIPDVLFDEKPQKQQLLSFYPDVESNDLHHYFIPVNSLIKDPNNSGASDPLIANENPETIVYEFPYKPSKLNPKRLIPHFIPVNSLIKDPNNPGSSDPLIANANPETKVYEFSYKPEKTHQKDLHPYFIPVETRTKDQNTPSASVSLIDVDDPESKVYEFSYKPNKLNLNQLNPHIIPVNSLIKDPNNPGDSDQPIADGNPETKVYEFPYKPDKLNPNHIHPYLIPVMKNPNDPSVSLIADSNPETKGSEFSYKPNKPMQNHLHPYFIPVNSLIKSPNNPSDLFPLTADGHPETTVYELPYKPDKPKQNQLHPYFIPVNSLIKDPNNLNASFLLIDDSNNETKVDEFLYKPDKLEPNKFQPYFIPINPLIKDPIRPNDPIPVIDDGNSDSVDFELNTEPSELGPDSPLSLDPILSHKLKKWDPNVSLQYPSLPTKPNHVSVSKLKPHETLLANMPSKLQNLEMPTTSQEDASILERATPPKALHVTEWEIIGFIRDAIAIIEGMIPVVEFDLPTLYIIAKIKTILEKDIEVDDYVIILKLYRKLINYLKHLNSYKQIIHLIELPGVPNLSKLQAKKVVELTYLVKRPQPVVYYPYYYVKYRLPYPSFVIAAKNLLLEKPHLRMNTHELYEELLSKSKVDEASPALKNQENKDIMGLTFKSGSFVDARLVGENGTLPEELNILKHITNFTAEEKDLSQVQFINTNPENDLNVKLSENEVLNKIDKTNEDKQKIKLRMSTEDPHTDGTLLRTGILNDSESQRLTTETNLHFTSFESNKLRDDILRGEYVGLPFLNYPIPTKALNETNAKTTEGSIAIQKLADSTLQASKVREANQHTFRNSDGLMNLDNQKVSLNTGTDNIQESVNISNPKLMMNSAGPVLIPDVASPRTFVNSAFNQVDQKNFANMWTNQQNYYNTGGLVNFDNQNILLNTGNGNRQSDVNIVNPKVMYNDVSDTKTSKPPIDQFNNMNENAVSHDETTLHQTLNTKPSQESRDQVTAQQSIHNSSKAVSHDGLVKFENTSEVFEDHKDNKHVENSQNAAVTTRPSFEKFDNNQPHDAGVSNENMPNFNKNIGKDSSRPNRENILSIGEKNESSLVNYNNDHSVRLNDEVLRPQDNQDTNLNKYVVTPTSQVDNVVNYNENSVNSQAANHGSNNGGEHINFGPGTNPPNNAVSPNNNQYHPEFDYQNSGSFGFNTGMASQQNHGETSQLNIVKVTSDGFSGLPVSQQNIATYGAKGGYSTYPGLQTNSYEMVPKMQVYYSRPISQRYSMRFQAPAPYSYVG